MSEDVVDKIMREQEEYRAAVEALPAISSVTLDVLERRYRLVPEPTECRVCGSEMGISSMGPDAVKWRCKKAGRALLQPYSRENSDHYRQSEVVQYETGDPMVLALVAAFRSLVG